MVEFSPATREARVRFPASASSLLLLSFLFRLFSSVGDSSPIKNILEIFFESIVNRKFLIEKENIFFPFAS